MDAQRERGSKAHPLVGRARCRCRGGHAAGPDRPPVAAARIGGGAAPLGHRGGRMLGQEISVAQPGGAILPGLGTCLWPDPNWTGRHDRWRWIAWEPQQRGSAGRSRVATVATVALRGSKSVGGAASAAGAEGHVAEPRASGGARGAPSGVGVWGQPGRQAGTRAGESQRADHGAVDRWISGGKQGQGKERERSKKHTATTPPTFPTQNMPGWLLTTTPPWRSPTVAARHPARQRRRRRRQRTRRRPRRPTGWRRTRRVLTAAAGGASWRRRPPFRAPQAAAGSGRPRRGLPPPRSPGLRRATCRRWRQTQQAAVSTGASAPGAVAVATAAGAPRWFLYTCIYACECAALHARTMFLFVATCPAERRTHMIFPGH